MIRRSVPIIALFTFLAAPLTAQNAPSIAVRTAQAQNPFEEGTYQALGAMERLGQQLYRFGIGTGFRDVMGMRMNTQSNPTPEPRQPDTFRTMIAQFADDLDAARATLARTTPDAAKPFVVDVNDLWLDINANGARDPGEQATLVLAGLIRGRRAPVMEVEEPLEVRFDGADHAWLVAYTHVLSATSEAILAFDPTPIFADLVAAETMLAGVPTIPYTFDEQVVRAQVAKLEAEWAEIEAEIDAITERRDPLDEELRQLRKARAATSDAAKRATLDGEIRGIRDLLREPAYDLSQSRRKQNLLRRQIASARTKLPPDSADRQSSLQARRRADLVEGAGDTPNAVYALLQALRQTPDRHHIEAVARHMRGMFEHNRLFWATVVQETDDDREWVPNPAQTSALGVAVNAETAETWQAILADFEALLDGRLLIPHPLLPQDVGVSLAAWLEDPSALDLVEWAHGRGAYPYLARGPMISNENWLALQRLTQNNAFAFSLFLN